MKKKLNTIEVLHSFPVNTSLSNFRGLVNDHILILKPLVVILCRRRHSENINFIFLVSMNITFPNCQSWSFITERGIINLMEYGYIVTDNCTIIVIYLTEKLTSYF